MNRLFSAGEPVKRVRWHEMGGVHTLNMCEIAEFHEGIDLSDILVRPVWEPMPVVTTVHQPKRREEVKECCSVNIQESGVRKDEAEFRES